MTIQLGDILALLFAGFCSGAIFVGLIWRAYEIGKSIAAPTAEAGKGN